MFFQNPITTRETRTERERYLEDELQSFHEQQERESRDRQQEIDESDRLRQVKHMYEMREASDWPDALNKQICLCRQEVSNGGDEDIGNFFANNVAACEKAQEFWREIEASKHAIIEVFEQQIAALYETIRSEVADRLEGSDPRREFSDLASALRANQLSNFLDW
jgi:hypothetical protein